jgi:hypothetical protein
LTIALRRPGSCAIDFTSGPPDLPAVRLRVRSPSPRSASRATAGVAGPPPPDQRCPGGRVTLRPLPTTARPRSVHYVPTHGDLHIVSRWALRQGSRESSFRCAR